MAGEDSLKPMEDRVKLTEVDGEPAVVLRMPDGSAVARPLKKTNQEETEENTGI